MPRLGLGIGLGLESRPLFVSGSNNTPRTQAFITASGITDPTIISALNDLDNTLISYGLLPSGTGAGKLIAAHPICGGTATTCKFNFVNPADTDAAFRLTFSGGWTFSAQGAKPNGTNAYADTYININSDLSQDNTHVSIYIREDLRSGDRHDIGNAAANTSFYFSAYYQSVNAYISNLNNTGLKILSNVDTRGLWLSQRTNSSNRTLYKNGSLIDTFAAASTTPVSSQVRLSALGNAEFSNRQFAFFTAGQGLTNTEVSNLYTAIQTFQTALFRQV